MIQVQRILVATDFTEFGNLALQYGRDFAKAFSASLHVIFVAEPPVGAYGEFGTPLVFASDWELQIASDGLRQLEKVTSDFTDVPRIERVAKIGSPYAEIIRYAKEQDCDLIIVGTHGHRAIAHFLLGSTAEKIVRMAPCPVLTVRQGTRQFLVP